MSINYPSLSLPDIIREVVTSVQTELLTTLQDYDSTIQLINFEHGNWMEIEQIMQQKKQNQNYVGKQFPCILLIEDITIERGNNPNLFGTAKNVNVIIANWTKNSYSSAQRETVNFEPILRPIYYSFLKYLEKHRATLIYNQRSIEHDMTERKYWGMEANTKNALGYFIDAIDITNLDIPLDWEYCNNIINANIS